MVAAADQGGHIVCQLQGGKEVIGLADGGGNGLAVGPGLADLLGVLGTGQHPLGVADLNARAAAQAELAGVVVQPPNAREPPHLVEEVVAGHGDGLGHIHRPVGAAGGVIDPALGLGELVVGVDAPVHNGGGGGDHPGFQPRHGGAELKGGAGGIGAVGGPVEHGQGGIFAPAVVHLVPLAQVVGGVAGQGQHLPGAHADDRRRAAPGHAVSAGHGLDGGGQGVLGHLLQVDVNGQGHGVAGLGLLGVKLAGNLAVFVGGHQLHAVYAVEILLKGLLHAALSHQVVHGVVAVVLVFFVPVLGEDAAHPAQDVGGIGGVIHPLAGGARGHACKVAVHHLADHPHRHILGEHIAAGNLRAVPHPGDEPGLLVGVVGGNGVDLPQLCHHLVAGEGQGDLLLPGIGDLVVVHPGCKGLAGLRVRQAVGVVPAQGQGVDPGEALLGAELQKPPHRRVARSVIGKALGGEFQGVGQAVRHQHLAVSVGDDAPAGLHHLPLGGTGGGKGPVAVSLNDLVMHQQNAEQAQHRRKHAQQHDEPGAVGIILFHGSEFLLSRGAKGRKKPSVVLIPGQTLAAASAWADIPGASGAGSAAAPCPAASGRRGG